MSKPKTKTKKKAPKNLTDANLLARSVVEAAIGEPLNVDKKEHPKIIKR
jgi:hypothetical protein